MTLSMTSWIKTPPIPTSLASISSLNCLEKNGVERVGPPLRIHLILLKATSHLLLHVYLTFFLRKSVSGFPID